MWTPVDVRFNDLLQRFRRHQQFVKDELALQQAKLANEAEIAAACERRLAADERRLAAEERFHAEQARLKLNDLSIDLQCRLDGICPSI